MVFRGRSPGVCTVWHTAPEPHESPGGLVLFCRALGGPLQTVRIEFIRGPKWLNRTPSAEHRGGRRLAGITLIREAGRPVVGHGGDRRERPVRGRRVVPGGDARLSAAMPGLRPRTDVALEADGRRFDERYVDGGVAHHALGYGVLNNRIDAGQPPRTCPHVAAARRPSARGPRPVPARFGSIASATDRTSRATVISTAYLPFATATAFRLTRSRFPMM